MFFSPLSIGITSLGEERANLSAFRMFVRFAVCDCDTPWTFFYLFFLFLTVPRRYFHCGTFLLLVI